MDELTNEREGRRRSQLNLETLERIPIPEGLEERLLAKIDEWEAHPQPLPKGWELQQKDQQRHPVPRVLRYAAVAASIALVFGVGFHYLQREEILPSLRERLRVGDGTSGMGQGVGLAEQDTYQDPVKAQQEAERALNMLAMNLNKGMGHLEKAKALSEKTEQSFYEKLKVMK